MSGRSILLKNELISQHSVTVIDKLRQKILRLVLSIDFGLLVNEMQASLTLIADTCRNHDVGRELGSLDQQTAWMDIGFFLLRPDAVVLIINGWIDVKDLFTGEENLFYRS